MEKAKHIGFVKLEEAFDNANCKEFFEILKGA